LGGIPGLEACAMESHSPRGLLIALGLVLLAIGGQPLVNYFSGDLSIHSFVPSAIACIGGLGLVIFGFFWKPKPRPLEAQSSLLQNLTKWSNSPIPYAVMLILLWIYFETLAIQRNNEVAMLRNDEQSIATVIDRLVMPRHLTKGQQRVISDFLSQFGPHEYAFKLPNDYEEAGSFRSDIEQSLIKAGWTRSETNPYTYTNEIREGLTLDFIQTPEHAQKGHDPKNPNASELLQMAFGLAGVRIDGGGGGGGANLTEDLLVISIGRPRRDSYALTLPED
jgi:hypothetical protein